MLTQNPNELIKYKTSKRLWQGIPSIEVTKKGRIFLTFYSGGTKEEIGNYAMVTYSDNGIDFSEPIAVAYKENYRCYDSCLWIDPLGRLWFTWSRCPDDGVFGAICENPDAKEADDGYIYITYDRERGCKDTTEEALACAREILIAKISEEDIIKGSLQSENGYLKHITSKLGDLSEGDFT